MSPTRRSSPLLNRCPAPKISIEFANSRQKFTTRERIEGEVTVTVKTETRFSEVQISLEGSSRVNLLQPIPTQRETGASHIFLALHQHAEELNYPASRVFRPGTVYRFPYTFVVPDRLPPKSCNHKTLHVKVRQAHREVPPTLNLGTLSQSLCEISYHLRVAVCRQKLDNDERPEVLANCTQPLHLVPAPSFCTSEKPETYRSNAVQKIKSQGKTRALGRLETVASTLQQIQVPSPYLHTDIADTHVALQLWFDPVGGDTPPPRLAKIYPTLKQSTLFSTEPQEDYPCISKTISNQMSRGAHVQISSLPSQAISSIRWTKHVLPHHSRSSSFEQPSQPSSIKGHALSSTPTTRYYYTASILVPITLPKTRDLVPTFHSCLLSRTYTLELRLSYRMPNSLILRRITALEVPVNLVGVCALGTSSDTLPEYNTIVPEKQSNFVPPSSPYDMEQKAWNTESPNCSVQYLERFLYSEKHEACAPPKYGSDITQ